MRADVSDFKHAIPEQLVLNVDIVILDVRRAQIRIDREHVRVEKVGEDRHAASESSGTVENENSTGDGPTGL